MKHLCFAILLLFALGTTAQTHHLGLNFGINQILSFNDEPPFGKGSPWEADLGYGFDLSYHYIFKNGFSIGLSSTLLNLRFRNEEQTLFVESENALVTADEILQHRYFYQSLWLAYNWAFSNRTQLLIMSGFGRQFYYKEVYHLQGFTSTKSENPLEWGLVEKFNALHIGINPSYTLIQNWNYRINLSTSLRAVYILDYLNFSSTMNRFLPQVFLGIELELGRRQR